MEKMFNEIAQNYDFLNNIISLFTHKIIKRNAVKSLKIKPNSTILDLCTGSGDLGRIAKDIEPTSKVIGVDISDEMLKIAKKKNKDIIYIKCDAKNLNFEPEKFDYILMGFGFRNIKEKETVIYQIKNVLKKDGCFLHLDFGYKNIFSKLYDIILHFLVKFFFKNKEAYYYLIKSKQNFLNPDEIINLFQEKGFELIMRKTLMFGIISYQIFSRR